MNSFPEKSATMDGRGRVQEIDGLRAIAVLGVIVYHYHTTYLPFGYLGVDIFYAISGYVITKSILDRVEAGTFTINDFFMRRAKRLLPALLVVVGISVLISAMLMKINGPLATGAAAFVGLSNFYLWVTGNDYFGDHAEYNPLMHTWSLGVEEQFYLFFPFLLVLILKSPHQMRFTLAGVAIASLTAYLWFWSGYRMSVFYLTPFRLWELLAGALISLAHRNATPIWAPRFQAQMKYVFLTIIGSLLLSSKIPEHLATVLLRECRMRRPIYVRWTRYSESHSCQSSFSNSRKGVLLVLSLALAGHSF